MENNNFFYERFITKYLTFASIAIIAIGMTSTRTMHARNDYSFRGLFLWSFKYIIIVLLLFIPLTFLSLKKIRVTEEYIELNRIFRKRYYYNRIDEWMYLKNTSVLYLYSADKEYKIILKHIRNTEALLQSLSQYIKIKKV